MKNDGKYPEGPISQHKELATGAPLQTTNTKNLDPNGKDGSSKTTLHKSGGHTNRA